MSELRFRPEIVALAGYVPGRRPQAGNTRTFKLSSNEAIAAAPAARDAAGRHLDDLHLYPDMAATEAIAAIADHHDVAPESIALGVGSVEVISQAIRAVSRAGDEIVFPWRSFEAYPLVIAGAGATPVAVPLDGEGRNDLEAMLSAITPATTCVVVCNPNNPTGTTVDPRALADFIDAVPSSVLVLVDEAYVQFIDGDTLDVPALAAERSNVLSVRTFSKAYGLAGLRIGYGLGSPRLIAEMRKLSLPFAVSALAQDAAVAALQNDAGIRANVAEVAVGRRRLVDAATERGLRVLPSAANFVWIPTSRAADVAHALEGVGVLVRPFPEGVRISIGDAEAMDSVVGALPDLALLVDGAE